MQLPLLSVEEQDYARKRLLKNYGSILKLTPNRPPVSLSDALEELDYLSRAMTHSQQPFLSADEVKLAKDALLQNVTEALDRHASPCDEDIVIHR